MPKTAIILIVLFCLAIPGYAEEKPVSSALGIGMQLNQYQRDFGLGLTISSPAFIHDRVALRLRGNIMFNEHPENAEITWSPYANISLGVVSIGGKIGSSIRLYGEGGFIALLPSDKFSSQSFEAGGYGLFGFEFFMSSRSNYFIEIGGIGTGAKADMLATKPIYSNGLMISAGFRVLL